MFNMAWIDRLVDTWGCALCFHVIPSAAWKRTMLKPGALGISAVSETRKLATILVAHIVGYSRLTGADEDRILVRLRTLRSDLIDPTIAVHHGEVVKRTGDGAIIEFRSVAGVLGAARAWV
jgi:class 3 adenylate cyclase